ncbi:MAG: DUF123 domain-containing protein [Anaerolineae bacterium]
MHIGSPAQVVVGALGTFGLDAGYYLYVGSALNGLAGRLRRHCRTDGKKLHWHIDYLRAQVTLVEIWWTRSAERLECDWAAAVRGLPRASEPVAGFGASDCRCSSHLFYFADKPSLDEFAAHWPNRIKQSPCRSPAAMHLRPRNGRRRSPLSHHCA